MLHNRNAQTMIEYILLLTSVAAIVLVGFSTFLPRIREGSNVYFNRVAVGILGNASRCGDGFCDEFETATPTRCPQDNC